MVHDHGSFDREFAVDQLGIKNIKVHGILKRALKMLKVFISSGECDAFIHFEIIQQVLYILLVSECLVRLRLRLQNDLLVANLDVMETLRYILLCNSKVLLCIDQVS